MGKMSDRRRHASSQEYRTATKRIRDAVLSTDFMQYLPPDREGFPVAYGWHRQVIRTSMAADKLALAGFGYEAAPLRRSMIEHMAFLVWLSDDEPAALAVMNDSTIKSTKDLAQYAREVGYDIGDDPEWLNEAEFTHHTDTYLGKVPHLLPKYQLSGMKVPWLIETRLSHPTKDTANAWWDQRTTPPTPRATPTPDLGDDPTPEVAFLAVYFATLVLNSYLADHPWTALLEQIASKFSLPTEIPARIT